MREQTDLQPIFRLGQEVVWQHKTCHIMSYTEFDDDIVYLAKQERTGEEVLISQVAYAEIVTCSMGGVRAD